MRNPLTIRIESRIGAFLVIAAALFTVLIGYRAVTDFRRELEAISSGYAEILTNEK